MSSGEKIIGDDDDAFSQATSLKQLLVHREDAVYVPRQAQAATFNMRTWALNSRSTGNQLSGTTGGGNDKQSQRSKRAQRQWAVDEGPTFVEDKPFFDYTFNHSAILAHRDGCAVRPTHPAMLDTIRQHKPGAPANVSMALSLDRSAEEACSRINSNPPQRSISSNGRLPHDVPKAFGAVHHEALYNSIARRQRRLECAQKQMQAAYEEDAYCRQLRGDLLSRPDSPDYGSSTTSKPQPHSPSITDFLVSAATSRPPSQQHLPPLPDYYRVNSPLFTDGQVEVATPVGELDCQPNATATTEAPQYVASGPQGDVDVSLRTRRCLQVKGGSRVRRYYGAMSMLYADERAPRGGGGGASLLPNEVVPKPTLPPRTRNPTIMTSGGILERLGEAAVSNSFDTSGHVHGTVGEATYKYRCFGAVERFAQQGCGHQKVFRTVSSSSPCDTPVPLYYRVPYAELLEEQQIIIEQRDIHNKAYETAKELYRKQTAYVAVAMEAMAEGDFLRKLPVSSSALADIPELELERMRLQVDSVPVMVMQPVE